MNILVLSPHADDAVFSCADHINYWIKRAHRVSVCTVFTKFSSGKVSLDAKKYVLNSGYSDILLFEKARNEEDIQALNYLGVKYLTPNLFDGAFRIFNDQLVYKSFNKLFSGITPTVDGITIDRLCHFLEVIHDDYDLVVAPLGIGNHADHLITSLCSKICVPHDRLAYYLDVPYYFDFYQWNASYLKSCIVHKPSFKWTTSFKRRCVAFYISQKSLIIRNNKKVYFNEHLMYFPEVVLSP